MEIPEEIIELIKQPPAEAMEFLKKKYPSVNFDYSDMEAEARARAFTVSKITQLDILQTMLTALQTAAENGSGYNEFKKNIKPYLEATGWYDENGDTINSRRLQLIYKTNIDAAIAAGRWQQMWETRDNRPYLQYRIDQLGISERHRAEHEALDGRIFEIEDQIWGFIYPPRGFNCNCGVVSISERYMKNKGLKPDNWNDKLEEKDGKFGYNVKNASGTSLFITPPKGFESHIAKGMYQPNLDKYDSRLAQAYIKGSINGPAYTRFFEGKSDTPIPVAVLNNEVQQLLQTQSRIALLHAEQRNNDLNNDDYYLLQSMIEDAGRIEKKGKTLTFLTKNGDDAYEVVMEDNSVRSYKKKSKAKK